VLHQELYFFSDIKCHKFNTSVFMSGFPRGLKCEIIGWEIMKDESKYSRKKVKIEMLYVL
jgi:hypothetical protein